MKRSFVGRPREGIIADHSSPFVVVILGTNREGAKVDGTRAPEAFATGVVHLAVLTSLLMCCLAAPICIFVQECNPSLAVNTEIVVIVVAPGLEEEDLRFLGGLSQARAQSATPWPAYLGDASSTGQYELTI